jgi:hypothetical protein
MFINIILQKMKNKKNEPVVKAADKEKSAMKTDTDISGDDIRKRAYEIYLEHGDLYAPPEADWLKAETELRDAAYKKQREKNL